jgi:hypothetical protein
MPQPRDWDIEMIQINNWLGKCRRWPLLCNVLWAMRTVLSDATTRMKEVREFPIGVIGRRLGV